MQQLFTGGLTDDTNSILQSPKSVESVRNLDLISQQESGLYDKNILERSRTLWQFGDWHSLASIKMESLQHHPDCARLSLLAASGYAQLGDIENARYFARLAQNLGCEKKLIVQIFAAGVYNNLGRAAIYSGQQARAQKHFESAIATGMPCSETRLLAKARFTEQFKQILNTINSDGKRLTIDNYIDSFSSAISQLKQKNRLIIRSIHHFPCTGGTLFTKCLAALPNVVVLNEIDPHSRQEFDIKKKANFNPTDIISLLHQSFSNFNSNLIDEIFLNDIHIIANSITNEGKILILREHSHGAYLIGNQIRRTNTILNILKKCFETKSIITVRDPIDSYLSLQHNDWIHYHPKTFDEYCYRYLCFLNDNNNIDIVRYEDFLLNPHDMMKSICRILGLEYSPEFIHFFHKFKFSGDSGRTGRIIEPRPRREYNDEFKKEVKESSHYAQLIERLGYQKLY